MLYGNRTIFPVIALPSDGNEIQVLKSSNGPDAKRRIGPSGQHFETRFQMPGKLPVIPRNIFASNSRFLEFPIQEQPGACSARSIADPYPFSPKI
jgi:hypothetical protein